MLYCEKCRKARGWLEGLTGKLGRCLLCKREVWCYDVRRDQIPPQLLERDDESPRPQQPDGRQVGNRRR